jgi:hypothetical protein
MRYVLGTLLILLAIGPPVLAGAWYYPRHTLIVIACFAVLVVLIPMATLLRILRRELREAEEDLRAAGAAVSGPAGGNSVQGKRPGQFGIYSLFVLMTLAAIAFAIIRLPIPAPGKIVALMALWLGFMVWQMRNLKFAASPTGRFNMAVTNLVGEALVIAMFAWTVFGAPRLLPWYVDFLFFGAMAIGPALGIRRSINAMRQAVSADKNRPAVRSKSGL